MGNRASCSFHLIGQEASPDRADRFLRNLAAHLEDAVPYFEHLEATRFGHEYVRVDFRVPADFARKIGVPHSCPESVLLFTWATEGYGYADEHVRCLLFLPLDREDLGVISPDRFVAVVKNFARTIGTTVRTHDQLMAELNDPTFPVDFLEP